MSRRQFYHSILTLAIVLSLLASSTAHAADFDGIGLSPGPKINHRDDDGFHYTVSAGTLITDSVKVVNTSGQARSLTLSPTIGSITAGNHFICAQSVDTNSWITFDNYVVSLVPSQRDTVAFRLQVPANTEAGEYEACITAQEQQPTVASASSVRLQSRVALRVSITIPGNNSVNFTTDQLGVRHNNRQVFTDIHVHSYSPISLYITATAHLDGLLHTTKQSSTHYSILPFAGQRIGMPGMARPFWGGWYRLKVTVQATPVNHRLAQTARAERYETSKVIFLYPTKTAGLSVIAITLLLALLIGLKFKYRKGPYRLRHRT